MKSTLYLFAALLVTTVLSAPAQAVIAFDSASDPAYSSGWAAGSNGGSGFGPWDFTKNAYGPFIGPAAWPAVHFIDSAPVPFNDLGAPAFALALDDCGYCGEFTSATRPFNSPLAIGQSFSMDFDNPLLASPDFQGQDNIISFSDSAGSEVFGVFGSNFFDSQQWNLAQGGGSLGISDLATSHGSSIVITRTGTNTLDMVFHGVSFPGLVIGGSGDIAMVTVNLGETYASNGDGSREFFINNLRIFVPEPSSLVMMSLLGISLVASARRRKKS